MPDKVRRLRGALLGWYDSARRDLPWRRTHDPYAIWLSEVMLQQTRVETVIPYYERFVRELPNVKELAEAPPDRVMSLWSGLGYYRRARMLHDGARQICDAGGELPTTARALRDIKGIGRYTAGAIASIAFGERAALVDGNVARVLARLFAVTEDVRGGKGLARIWDLAEELVPEDRPGDFNQALMELGATVCVPRTPRCDACPVRDVCSASAAGTAAELPRVSARSAVPLARQIALVATVGTAGRLRVLLARRRPGGLFGGLWEPPTLSGDGRRAHARASADFASLLGIELPDLVARGTVTHVLTHKRLAAKVLSATFSRAPRCRLGEGPYEAASFVAPGAFGELGMSTLTRKILARAKVPCLTPSSSDA